MTAVAVLPPIPDPLGPVVEPEVTDRVLANGLRVVIARRATVPTVEVRLRVPFAAPDDGEPKRHAARAELLASCLLSASGARGGEDVGEAFADAGAQLRATVDPQRLLVTGRTLADGLERTLSTLAGCLAGSHYRQPGVDADRRRLLERVRLTRAAPRRRVQDALLQRCFGSHPIIEQVAEAELLAGVTARDLSELHAEQLVPLGSVLTVVGDVWPEEVCELLEAVFTPWWAGSPARCLTVPAPRLAGGVDTVELPGVRQAEVRLAGPAITRDDPGHAAQSLANHVLGGYFLSRLVANLRERHGYIYAGGSSLVQFGTAALTMVEFASGPSTVSAALEQAMLELDRISSAEPPTGAEVDGARAQLCGTVAISMSTQAGLAESLAGAYGAGLDHRWLTEYLHRLRTVALADVQAAAARYRPEQFTGVLLAPPAAG